MIMKDGVKYKTLQQFFLSSLSFDFIFSGEVQINKLHDCDQGIFFLKMVAMATEKIFFFSHHSNSCQEKKNTS